MAALFKSNVHNTFIIPMAWHELSNWLLCNNYAKVIVKQGKDACQIICKKCVKLT